MGIKSEKEINEVEMRSALNSLLAAKNGETRSKIFRQIVGNDRIVDRLSQFIDMTLALDDPARVESALSAASYLKKHPGPWTENMEKDLRASMARDGRRHIQTAWDDYIERLD